MLLFTFYSKHEFHIPRGSTTHIWVPLFKNVALVLSPPHLRRSGARHVPDTDCGKLKKNVID